jgi:hypothetical protein
MRAPIAPGNGGRSNPSFSLPQRAQVTVWTSGMAR